MPGVDRMSIACYGGKGAGAIWSKKVRFRQTSGAPLHRVQRLIPGHSFVGNRQDCHRVSGAAEARPSTQAYTGASPPVAGRLKTEVTMADAG